MNITIVGGGNIGTQFAVHCAAKGHNVKIYTSRSADFQKRLFISNECGEIILEADIEVATYDAKCAFKTADLIFVTMPAYCMHDIAKLIEPYARAGMLIGLIPGTGGGECCFKKCIEQGAIVFGLQRVPSVARLRTYGQNVCASGYRKELFLAAIPNSYVEDCCSIVSNIFDMPCTGMPNYLNVTLTPSNPILHTTRLYTLFKDYDKNIGYDSVPLFYEEWNDDSSVLLLKCDQEVQNICTALEAFDLSYVRSLKEHYESDTADQLTRKLCSILSLKGLTTPTICVDGKLHPDFKSRYFTADFPFGLSILLQIGNFAGVDVSNMKETYEWYANVTADTKMFDYRAFGICNSKDFQDFYMK